MTYRKRRDLISAALWWSALIYLVAFCWIVGAFLYHALAHEARPTAAQPLGWRYPWACCSGQDCKDISDKAVQEGPDGYTITIAAGTHPIVKETTVFKVPYGDPKIKDSPDGLFHLCVSAVSGNVLCFYVPPRGY